MAYKAFVASTLEDLKQHRTHVIDALSEAGFFVDPMEKWTAASDEPAKFSQERIQDCDLCILLVGFRRGHVPRGSQLSITQLEYQSAVALGIDVLVFMLDEDSPWPRRFDELSKDPEISRWRDELKETRTVAGFGLEPHSLEIAPALTRWLLTARQERPAPGDVILGSWKHHCSGDGSELIYVSRFVVTKSDHGYVMSVLDQRDAPEIEPSIALSEVRCDGDIWTFKTNWGLGRVGSVKLHRITNEVFQGNSSLYGEVVQFDRFVKIR